METTVTGPIGLTRDIVFELQLAKDATGSGDLPNALQFEATAGFNHVHDTALLEEFVDDYFAMLRRIYTDKTNEMATNLIEGLYPVMHAGRVVKLQSTADAWLAANEDAHDALRRLVVEGRDNVRRALKNQAVDAAWGED